MFEFLKNFLLKNQTIKQTILKNTFWLAFAEIIARFSGIVIVIFIARSIGALEYGKFTFALSFASIISIISDLGVIDISTRDLSQNKENSKKISDVFSLILFLCFLTLIISVIGSFFITADAEVRAMIFILTLFVSTNSIFAIFFSFLRSRQRMEYEALIKILQAVITGSIIFWIIFYMPAAETLSYGYFLANLIVLIPLILYFNGKIYKLSFNIKKETFDILKISWPLSFGFMIGWIYIYINSVILGYFNLIAENGWYNAASKIALATIIPATLVIRSFYPILSNFYVSSKEKLQKAWDYLTEIMILLTIPIVIGGVAVSSKVIELFYGEGYQPSVLALQLLMIVIGFSFINYPYAIMLIVANQQKKNFLVLVTGSILNIVLSFLLIKQYGFYGCIIATIIVSLLSFLAAAILTSRFAGVAPFNLKLLKVLFSSAGSAAVMYYAISANAIKNLNLFLICAIGAVVYFFVISMFYKIFFPERKIFSAKQWIQ